MAKDFSLTNELVDGNTTYDLSHMNAEIYYDANLYSLTDLYEMEEVDREVSVRYYDGVNLNITKDVSLTVDMAYGEIYDFPVSHVLNGGSVKNLLSSAKRYLVSDNDIKVLAANKVPRNVTGLMTLITYDPISTHDDILSRAKSYVSNTKRYFQDSVECYMGNKGKKKCDSNACRRSDCACHVKNVNCVMTKKDSDSRCGIACKSCKCKRVTDRWKQNCSTGLPYGQPICVWIDCHHKC